MVAERRWWVGGAWATLSAALLLGIGCGGKESGTTTAQPGGNAGGGASSVGNASGRSAGGSSASGERNDGGGNANGGNTSAGNGSSGDTGEAGRESTANPAKAVGAPCIPSNELVGTFNGGNVAELNFSDENPACPGEGAVCIAAGFQGRVTCPYGQSADDLGLPADDAKRCRVPDSTGKPTSLAVTVEVRPQLVARQPKDAVFCSCHCAGPDPDASYCECPSGSQCVELLPSIGLANPLSGSYCVPAGITLKGDASGQTCQPNVASCDGIDRNP